MSLRRRLALLLLPIAIPVAVVLTAHRAGDGPADPIVTPATAFPPVVRSVP